MELAAWAAQLEASPLGAWMRGSDWAYPVVNLIHLAGLVLLVGNMLLLDLRLLGIGRRFALVDASSMLTRLAIAGLLLLIASGALLFAADAGPLLANPMMQAKLGLIAFGIANALAFRWWWQARLDSWDSSAPLGGRAQAALSLTCWIVVASLGRLIAYG
ncbi:MAG: hypothetical protein ABWZ78_15395 [Burkholderiaceae bacterium]